MKKQPTTVAFSGTQEQETKLDALIEKHKGDRGSLMPVMQGAQEIYGYLPAEVQRRIALGMGVPFAEVYGVATFYSQFLLNPKGKVAIAVCLGTACYVKGSGAIIEKLAQLTGVAPGGTSSDGKFSLDSTRCIGACGLAPVITINEDVYGRLTGAELESILAKYK